MGPGAMIKYVLTHSLMKPSPSREAANCAATREPPSILWNPEVHHRVHISPPPVPILSPIDPIPPIPSYLSKINFNIVYPSTDQVRTKFHKGWFGHSKVNKGDSQAQILTDTQTHRQHRSHKPTFIFSK
jgi:hypothetical protein